MCKNEKAKLLHFHFKLVLFQIIVSRHFVTWNNSCNSYLLDQQHFNFNLNADNQKIIPTLKELKMSSNKSELNNILDCEECDSVMEVAMAYMPEFKGHYTVCYLNNVLLIFLSCLLSMKVY